MDALAAVAQFGARMAEAVAENAHHDQRRLYLLELLRDAFGVEATDVTLESHVRVAEVRGRIDVLYRRLVFEVKRDLSREHDDVVRELTLYLDHVGERAFGLATDGARFEAYRLGEGTVELLDEISIAESDDAALLAWLDAYLFAQDAVRPTTEDIGRRFGPSSAVYLSARSALGELWDEVSSVPSVGIKRDEWDRLLRVVYGTQQGTDDLFLRHTYLAAVARLLAFLAIARQPPRRGEEMDVMTGPAFQRLDIENLVEEDFFTWITTPEIADRAATILSGLARHLGVYDTDLIDEDLLKHLYETLVDPADRHDLGEYYTPDWLADLLLREAGYGPGVRALDPSCGSGTFLFMAIRRLREAGLSGADLVEEAQTNLGGFDVHPLAVAIARANFVLALREDAREARRTITIPIWMADALATPEARFGRPITVSAPGAPGDPTEHFSLPTEMEEEVPGSLAKAVEYLIDYAQPRFSDEDAEAGLRSALGSLGADRFADTWVENLALFRRMVAEGRNTVWAFELANAVRPQVIARSPVDLIVGNPPWLPVRGIARSSYQDRVTELALEYGILEKRRGWQTGALELATVFLVFAADHYLRPGGRIAFVLPRGVLFGAKQHDRFRRLAITVPIVPREAFDLRGVRPLFRVPACAVVMEKEARST